MAATGSGRKEPRLARGRGQERAPLTQVRHPAEARVEADLSHLVGAGQEEVDHAVGDHAAREAEELVVKATPLPEAVPAAWRARLHAQQLPVGGGEARDLAHSAPDLRCRRGWLQEGGDGTGSACAPPPPPRHRAPRLSPPPRHPVVPLPCPFRFYPFRT